jgi:3-dehydroquinate dehydratase II
MSDLPGGTFRIGVLHGPNLRLLGRREPEIYGTTTLEQINEQLRALAESLGVQLQTFQSNHEGEILDWIEASAPDLDGFLLNPAALTHGSVALRDALLGVGRPFVEVHLSNTAAREPFRHRSLLADVAVGVVFGFGVESYLSGLRGLRSHLESRKLSG